MMARPSPFPTEDLPTLVVKQGNNAVIEDESQKEYVHGLKEMLYPRRRGDAPRAADLFPDLETIGKHLFLAFQINGDGGIVLDVFPEFVHLINLVQFVAVNPLYDIAASAP